MPTSISPLNLDFRQCKVLVAGDVMIDEYWLGDTSRVSPEAPVPVVKVNNHDYRLGGAANAALNARSLGADVGLAGIIGDDSTAKTYQQLLEQQEITSLPAQCQQASTIRKLRIISQAQQMVRADFETSFSQEAIEQLSQNIISAINDFDIVLLSDYAKGALSDCQAIIQEAKRQGKKIIIDPKGNDYQKYRQASLLTPNMSEFEAVMGICSDEQDLFNKAHQLIDELELEALLLTRSEKGMTLFFAKDNEHERQEHHHFNAEAKEVFDVTGAGDTVIATLTTALASGLSLPQATDIANTAASVVVGKMGAAAISPLDIKLAYDAKQQSAEGILNLEQLKSVLSFEKQLGKTIVFTNGCFDILHAGHVQYLNEAAALGDRLIVAINSDDSVKRLKGPERPINTVDDRMSVLSSLAAVDWVIDFEEDTPENLLKALLPDILVKGGDYSIEGVVGADIVIGRGGKVAVLSLQDGISTTKIIDSIKSGIELD